MQNFVQDCLTTVCIRYQFVRGMRFGVTGLLVGAVCGAMILVLQRADILADGPVGWLIALAATVLGFAGGLLVLASWQSVASLVDEDAARASKNRYAEFFKKMGEVLDGEPLPLGHRQTVRAYFREHSSNQRRRRVAS